MLNGNSGQAFTLDNFGLSDVSEGKLRALNFSEDGEGVSLNNKTIFTLTLKALKPIVNIGQVFRLKNAVLSEKFYSEEGDEIENIELHLEVTTGLGLSGGGTVSEQIIADAPVNHLAVYPNPFRSGVSFEFSLPEEDWARVSIFDSFGQLVARQHKYYAAGLNTISIDNLANSPSGLYSYTFELPERVFSGKIVKF